jgi:hypothetical protein
MSMEWVIVRSRDRRENMQIAPRRRAPRGDVVVARFVNGSNGGASIRRAAVPSRGD